MIEGSYLQVPCIRKATQVLEEMLIVVALAPHLKIVDSIVAQQGYIVITSNQFRDNGTEEQPVADSVVWENCKNVCTLH